MNDTMSNTRTMFIEACSAAELTARVQAAEREGWTFNQLQLVAITASYAVQMVAVMKKAKEPRE